MSIPTSVASFLWALPLGFLAEALGVVFQDEAFSLTAALGLGAFVRIGPRAREWAEEHVKRPLMRFGLLALGFTLLLAVIAPVLRGDAVDAIPALFMAGWDWPRCS
jgi:hypothetical protein